MNASINFIQNRIRLIPTSVEYNANIQRQIQVNENKINQIDKKIEHKERIITMEQGLLDSGKVLLKDLVESRNMQKTHIDTLVESRNLLQQSRDLDNEQIHLMHGIINAAKSLLKIKQDAGNKSANSLMKVVSQPLPEQGQAANVVTSQQVNNLNNRSAAEQVDKILENYNQSLRNKTQSATNQSLAKDSPPQRSVESPHKLETTDLRISLMIEAYRESMQSLDKLLCFLRIKA